MEKQQGKHEEIPQAQVCWEEQGYRHGRKTPGREGGGEQFRFTALLLRGGGGVKRL